MCRILRLLYEGQFPLFGVDISLNQVCVSASAAELTSIELRVTGLKSNNHWPLRLEQQHGLLPHSNP
jgi:hypothetical protein